MGEIASLLPLVSGAASAASSYSEGQASKMVANQNASYAKMQGAEALRIGEKDAGNRMLQSGQDAGAAAGKAAAQGILVSTGSAAATQEDIKRAAIQDASTIRTNAAKQAWGYGVEAANYKAQGRFAMIKGYTDAAQSIASGGMRYAYDQYKMGGQKPPPDLSTEEYEPKRNWQSKDLD